MVCGLFSPGVGAHTIIRVMNEVIGNNGVLSWFSVEFWVLMCLIIVGHWFFDNMLRKVRAGLSGARLALLAATWSIMIVVDMCFM